MKHKRILFISFFTIVFSTAFTRTSIAQTSFQVDTGGSIQAIVKSLEGPNVTISNISYNTNSETTPAGTFNDVLGLIDIKKGLIMTSGDAKLIIGPNNKPNASAGKKTNPIADSDSDLESVIPGETLYDLVTIEFDITVTNTVLSFNYIFGSEEYPEYEREYNDVFGFFISGPGISGVKNIALTDTGIPVSVKSINSSKNSNYFVSNGDGSNPAKDFYLQYDGFTKKLTAKTEVIPCETYHIKLAVADARDAILDSGVLIEEGSFTSTSKLDIDLEYEHKEYPYAVEGCNDGYFIVKKNLNWLNAEDPVTLEYTLTGLADIDVDYNATLADGNIPMSASGTIVIPANKESIKVKIEALPDVFSETEYVTLNLILLCNSGVVATASATMPIKDVIDFPMNSKVCKDVLMPINTDADSRYEFTWNADPALSCTACTSPEVQLSSDAVFDVHVKDNVSGCETDTEDKVTINAVQAYFKYSKSDFYPSTEAYFNNLSTGGEEYLWDFGDGQTATIFEPSHNYNLGETLEPQTFKITLNVSALQGQCKDEYDTTIVVQPFYVPNVITPNNDPLNDSFVVKGIEDGTWKINIYNRWGTLVYKSEHYNNDWKGEGVSNGVYYFRLSNAPGDRQFKGWIHVIKND